MVKMVNFMVYVDKKNFNHKFFNCEKQNECRKLPMPWSRAISIVHRETTKLSAEQYN